MFVSIKIINNNNKKGFFIQPCQIVFFIEYLVARLSSVSEIFGEKWKSLMNNNGERKRKQL